MGPPGGLHHVPATTSTLVVPNSATNSAPLVVGDHRRVLLVRQKKSVTNICHLFVTNGHARIYKGRIDGDSYYTM